MIEKEKQLWEKISQFELDDKTVAFNFSDRLARENNWTIPYSKRVIEEYKKFIFLCCTTQNGATPSDQVDQAWHLHLTYTKSYWIDFCKNTLEKEIHHNPTKGGNIEAEKYDDYYSNTKINYKDFFEQEPPIDIWPDNENRFSDVNFKRINISKNWVIKKPIIKLKKIAMHIVFAMIAITFIKAKSLNQSDAIVAVGLIVFLYVIIISVSNKNNGRNSGCSSGGCTSGCDSGHSGCSGHGCSSGCSGCGGD